MENKKFIYKDQIGYVELLPTIDLTMSNGLTYADATVVQSARVSYGKGLKTYEQDAKLIKFLIKRGHVSTLEHAFFSFDIKLPLFAARQVMRHKSLHFNEISRRYTQENIEFYIPNIWYEQSKLDHQGSSGSLLDSDKQFMLSLMYEETLREDFKKYKTALTLGVSKEQARMFLPVSLYTKIRLSGNLRDLVFFLKQRLDEHAQYETRMVAQAMKEFLFIKAPVVIGEFFGE